MVLPAFQFPSWYNAGQERSHAMLVLPAFQFPSWYNSQDSAKLVEHVLPAFQFPSWYNTNTKKAPVNRGFLGFIRYKNGPWLVHNDLPYTFL